MGNHRKQSNIWFNRKKEKINYYHSSWLRSCENDEYEEEIID